MSAPRIRSLKPECWQDKKIGTLSHEARLLFVVLVTMADDEGRLLARPRSILGHGYPFDDDVTPGKLAKWMAEISESGIVLTYEDDGEPYVAFRHWRRHQRINRPSPSTLPPPPDPAVVSDNAVPPPGGRTEQSVNEHGAVMEASSLARTPDPIRSDPDPIVVVDESRVRDLLAEIPTGDQPVVVRLRETMEILVTSKRMTFHSCPEGVENRLAAKPDLDHKAAAHIAVANVANPAYQTVDASRAFGYALDELERNGRPRQLSTSEARPRAVGDPETDDRRRAAAQRVFGGGRAA